MTQSNSSKLNIVTVSDTEFQMSRTFNAPRELVFRAITEPELLTRWWGWRKSTTVIEKLELRPGGSYRILSVAEDGTEYAFRGEIREVTPPSRFVWTFEFEGMPGHICEDAHTLEEQDGKTTVTTHSTFATKEDRDGMLESMEDGAAESYDRLEELLVDLQKS
ncbi:MAG TPA: SRPBCC family protein [Chloroflexota bacterium]|nr:SRPBCC family protein [Chloroflexota bacterium]